MSRTFGCIRGCVLAVAGVYLLITAISIVLRGGDVSGIELGLLAVVGLIVVGIAFFGHAGHWTG